MGGEVHSHHRQVEQGIAGGFTAGVEQPPRFLQVRGAQALLLAAQVVLRAVDFSPAK